MESVSGFDEIAVEKHMGLDLYTDGQRRPIMLLRSLVFILLRREGASDGDAHKRVMDMPLSVVHDHFEDEEEVDPEDPVTDSGKDSSQPDGTQPAVLSSVSTPASHGTPTSTSD